MLSTNKWLIRRRVAILVDRKVILLRVVMSPIRAIRSSLHPKHLLLLLLAGPALVALSTKANSAVNAVNLSRSPRLRGPGPAAVVQ